MLMKRSISRFPVYLADFPEKTEGEVLANDGKLLGRWFLSDLENVARFNFVPQGEENILFQEHFVGILLEKILDWYQTSA